MLFFAKLLKANFVNAFVYKTPARHRKTPGRFICLADRGILKAPCLYYHSNSKK
ncbi:MAG: hypothetical protein ACERLG_01330 [Sedimentibacter sp.]